MNYRYSTLPSLRYNVLIALPIVGLIACSANAQSLKVVPRVSVSELWSDNVNVQNGASKQSDFVTTVSPGVSITSSSGRLRGFLDYSLNQVLYAKQSSQNNTQNALNMSGTYEAVSNFAFVDFSGNISQQSISAFGTQTIDNTSLNSNRTEVSTFRVSPYVRGRFSDWASYQARYSVATTKSKSDLASDATVQDLNASLAGESGSRKFGWNVAATRQQQDYQLGRTTESDRLNTTLTYNVNPQLNFFTLGGRESNNYATGSQESHTTYGAGFNWAVSERTRLTGQAENRFFGKSHSFTFEHRTQRTAWRYTDSKDVNVANQLGVASLGPLYDLVYAQFASIEADPVKRAQLVQSFLQSNGLNGATNVNVGFLASGVSLQRRQDLSFTLLGLRDTVSVIATRTTSSRVSDIPTVADDLSNSAAVRQSGFTLTYSRRLSEITSMNVLASQLHSSGDSGSQTSTLKSFNVNFSTRLGLRTTGTVGARRTVSDGLGSSYTENALLGSVTWQF